MAPSICLDNDQLTLEDLRPIDCDIYGSCMICGNRWDGKHSEYIHRREGKFLDMDGRPQ